MENKFKESLDTTLDHREYKLQRDVFFDFLRYYVSLEFPAAAPVADSQRLFVSLPDTQTKDLVGEIWAVPVSCVCALIFLS